MDNERNSIKADSSLCPLISFIHNDDIAKCISLFFTMIGFAYFFIYLFIYFNTIIYFIIASKVNIQKEKWFMEL